MHFIFCMCVCVQTIRMDSAVAPRWLRLPINFHRCRKRKSITITLSTSIRHKMRIPLWKIVASMSSKSCANHTLIRNHRKSLATVLAAVYDRLHKVRPIRLVRPYQINMQLPNKRHTLHRIHSPKLHHKRPQLPK